MIGCDVKHQNQQKKSDTRQLVYPMEANNAYRMHKIDWCTGCSKHAKSGLV